MFMASCLWLLSSSALMCETETVARKPTVKVCATCCAYDRQPIEHIVLHILFLLTGST